MASEKVKQIVQLVYDIYNLSYEVSDFDKLRKLTHSIWEEEHCELLSELEKLDIESNVDFHLFWYDCLSFPQEMPRYFYKNGKPAYVLYSCIPSQIHECEKYVGFHDAYIKYPQYENSTFSICLDGRYKNATDYQIKLSFFNVFEIISINNSNGNTNTYDEFAVEQLVGNYILSARELPMIRYVFDNLELDKRYMLPEKRLFWISISGNSSFDLYIVFDKWEFQKKLYRIK